MWERNMGRNMTFKQNDQSTCERQIKLDTRDQMQAWERKRAVKCRRLTVVNVECASVWMNSFFPSRLKEEQTREGEWEKRQNVTIRQHYYTGHAQIVFKSVHFLFLFFFLKFMFDWPWLTVKSVQTLTAQWCRRGKLNQTRKKEQKGFFSPIWVMSETSARQGHDHNIKRLNHHH